MHPYIAVPATSALVWRAYSRRSLTPAGLVVAALTAVVHAIHPWSVFFSLLAVFFLGATAATKVLSKSIEQFWMRCSTLPGQTRCQSTIDTILFWLFWWGGRPDPYPSPSELRRRDPPHPAPLLAAAGPQRRRRLLSIWRGSISGRDSEVP